MSIGLESPARTGTATWELDVPWQMRDDTTEVVVAVLVEQAIRIGASDMYFVTNEDDVEVQVRHLGIVRSLAMLSRETGLRCLAHIRTMGDVRLHEKRHPQDGRWVFRLPSGGIVDLR